MAWEIGETIAYYKKQGAPADQNALIALLSEIQQECGGGIPEYHLQTAAQGLGCNVSFLQAVIKRIPRLRMQEGHLLELCGGPNCSKRAQLAAFVEKNYGTKPEAFTLKYVNCMRMCGKGPNLKWDGKLYHQADENLVHRLVEESQK